MTKQNKQWLIIVILIIGIGNIIGIAYVKVAVKIASVYTDQQVQKASDSTKAFTIEYTDKSFDTKVVPLFDSIYVELKKINN